MKELKLINSDKVVLLDDEDYSLFSNTTWRLMEGYAAKQIRVGDRRLNKREYVFLHKEILKASKEQKVDHKDRNKLNNQKDNLRFATTEQNIRNRGKSIKAVVSSYLGVTKDNRTNKFVAYITYKGKKFYFGTNYNTDLEAAIAYNKGIEKFNDPFIPINIISNDVLERLAEL